MEGQVTLFSSPQRVLFGQGSFYRIPEEIQQQYAKKVLIIRGQPALTLSVPPELTALTGVDALSHCVESFFNRYGTPWSDRIALEGAVSAYRHLAAAVKDGENLPAREGLALASFFGGVANANAGGNIVHALAYPLAKFGISHSRSVALMYPAVIDHLIKKKVEKLSSLGRALGLPEGEQEYRLLFETLIQPVLSMMSMAGIPVSLDGAGIDRKNQGHLSVEALKQERLLKKSPAVFSREDMDAVYDAAFQASFRE